jgi:tight adherence protein C
MFELIILIMSFSTVFTGIYILFKVIYRNKYIVNIRLDKISKDEPREKDNEINMPFFSRFVRPIFEDISRTVLKITPKEIVSSLEKKIIMAGKPYNFAVKDWVNIQVAVIICLPLVTIALGYYRNIGIRNVFFAILCEMGVGLILPNLILSKSAGERQKKILNSLPDVLDLLTVSVEAGLAFDGAITKVIDKTPGPIAKEFDSVLQEMKVGKQKREALRDMSDRLCIPDLTTFIGSIIQADQLGVSIGNVLRIQSEQMRQKRKQRAQEKAMKAPVKMLFPMVIFILPTIFSVLIGPVAIRVIETLMK